MADDGRGLQRVQVKATTRRGRGGRFVVPLCTRGGNQSFPTTRTFDPAACELLCVLTDAHDRYLILTAEVHAGHSLTLGARMAPFLLPCTPGAPGLP